MQRKNGPPPVRHAWGVAFALLTAGVLSVTGFGATGRVLILHTNDLHDHVRPGYGAVGGLPFVAGYLKSVRATRSDVIVLDAGDITEKGDLVAFKTHGRVTLEAMRRIGYSAVAIGNHDHDAGIDGLHRYENHLGQPFLCLNLLDDKAAPEFAPSRTFNVGGMLVAVIGMIVPRKANCLDSEESGRALELEAARLDREAHLVVALCHESENECAKWSRLAPSVDVFVSGHSHVALQQPMIVEETGACIVQAGCYAEWVGQLEIEVDLDSERLVHIDGKLVAMRHDAVPVDEAMLAWVRAEEQRVCPEAASIVAHVRETIGREIAWLAAEAMRRAAGVDIAFCHPGQIIRSALPAGAVDINALFLTGGQRGHRTVCTRLTGATIEAYLAQLAERNDQTAWSGFEATPDARSDDAGRRPTSLQPDRFYSVVMPELEWDTRFLRAVARVRETDPAGPLFAGEFKAEPSPVTYIDSLTSYVQTLTADGRDLNSEVTRLARERWLSPAVPPDRQ